MFSWPGLRIRTVFISSGSESSILGWTPIRIRIQSGSSALMTKKWIYLIFFTQILQFHKVCPSYRRSLQLSKEAIHHFKHEFFQIFFYFCGSFLPSWIRIPNPDPQTRLNPDPDPQPCSWHSPFKWPKNISRDRKKKLKVPSLFDASDYIGCR